MIVYFSGTGNSRYCAELLADKLGDELLDCGHYIKHQIAADLITGKPWVFVAPTYAWKLPRIVEQFIRSGSFMGAEDAYFVLTCGSGIGGAGAYLEQLCKDVGLRYRGVLKVVMPENYLAMFPVPDADQAAGIIRNAHPVLEQGAAAIREGRDFAPADGGAVGRMLSKAVNDVFYGRFIKADPFRIAGDCIGCGKCAESCVMNNIRMENGRPVWGGSCTHCMACISGCPTEAIEYGRKTRGKRRHQAPRYTK